MVISMAVIVADEEAHSGWQKSAGGQFSGFVIGEDGQRVIVTSLLLNTFSHGLTIQMNPGKISSTHRDK